ncbi:MAG TPA: type 1 glutamine amidotransferase [Candidatus Hydrogenedentes bacterium]|nr:type 1 glutamine amidotransferase [Candidatus Hydrogenedentota bacterium]
MRMHFLLHVPFEGPGAIEPWAVRKGFAVTKTRFWLNEPLPDPREIDWLAIMGGPMSVHDEQDYPWLAQEKAFIREAIRLGRTVLGICLGAQLIAVSLGGKVRTNIHKEIGWYPVTLTDSGRTSAPFNALPATFPAFHWHGETFDIPPGAIHTAASEACAHQAFSYGRHVAGLQFHLEYTADGIEAMLENCGHEIQPAPFIQSREAIRAGSAAVAEMGGHLEALLDALERASAEEEAE